MRKNARKPLTNFYDTDQSEEGYAPSVASSTQSQHVTIVVEDSPVSSISSPSADVIEENSPRFFTVATPILHNMGEAVMQAKRALQRLDGLILQAVWKCILRHSQNDKSGRRSSASDGSKPLSVQQRRAQLAATAVQPPSKTHSFVPRLFSSKPYQRSSKRRTFTTLPCTGPFLPISRFPVTPALNSKECTQFNRDLCDTIKETGCSGLVNPFEPSKSGANTRVRTSSLRSTALKLAMEKNNIEAGDLSLNQKSSSLMGSSVSLLILEVAKKRALAILFLRVLRLQAYQQRLLLEKFQWCHAYRLQSSTLRRWCTSARFRRSHRRTLSKRIVDHWRNVVIRQKYLLSLMRRFRAGLINRLRATRMCKVIQRRNFFLYWRNRFTKRRVMRAMSDAADSFRLSKDEGLASGGGSLHEKQYLSLLFLKDGLEEGNKSRYPRALLLAYRHWKGKMEKHLKLRRAEWQYAQCMKRHIFEKLKRAANCNQTSLPTQMTPNPPCLLPMLVSGFATACERPLDKADQASSQRFCTVSLTMTPPELLRYKKKMALRIAQTALLQRVYRLWRRRYMHHRGGWHYICKVQLATMRRWMNLLTRRRVGRATCQAVWDRWRERLYGQRLEGMADDVYARSTVNRTFYTWRLNFTFRSRNNMLTMRWCLRQWWERAALQIGARTLAIQHRQCLFYKWRTRSGVRGHCRTLLLLADTLRETILLVGCMRVWREKVRDIQKTRAMCGIIERLNLEHCREVCFFKWKGKVFKSASLPRVVTVSET